MPLDFLFRRSEPRRDDFRDLAPPRLREPPRLEPPRAIESARDERPRLPPPLVQGAPLPVLDEGIRVRAMSPRQMQHWAHEMYMTGWIGWDDYREATPAELLPGYDQTVGALTGEPARPDHPRDMLAEMEERLDFARRHFIDDDEKLRGLMRIVAVMRWQDEPVYDS